MQTKIPENIEQLRQRVDDIAGLTLGELARILSIRVPSDFRREKGWAGMLIEKALGASAGSKPTQDFPELGIELKTLPLSYEHVPLETTYVCYAPLKNIAGVTWQSSNVRNKLQHVLWLPLQGERDIPPNERMIGHGFFWQPSADEDRALQSDWEELMELIATGKVESITARIGEVLQLRPKAANGSKLTEAIGEHGSIVMTRPRGFYLKKNFTSAILNAQF